jgi:hypothetical protein
VYTSTLSVEFRCVVSLVSSAIAVVPSQPRLRDRHTRTHDYHGRPGPLNSLTHGAHFLVDLLVVRSQASWAHVPRKPPPFSKPKARRASQRAREPPRSPFSSPTRPQPQLSNRSPDRMTRGPRAPRIARQSGAPRIPRPGRHLHLCRLLLAAVRNLNPIYTIGERFVCPSSTVAAEKDNGYLPYFTGCFSFHFVASRLASPRLLLLPYPKCRVPPHNQAEASVEQRE